MSNTEQNVKIVIDDKMYFITEEVNSSDFNEISQEVHEEVDEGGQDDDLGFWSQHDNALRDLLVFLVQKHCIEDMMDSKMKSQCWDFLYEDFCKFTHNLVIISKQQLGRKWHNWKQYNKKASKLHPFAIVGTPSEEQVKEKCDKLIESLEKLNQNQVSKVNWTIDRSFRKKDFVVQRTGASASALSVKRLEHEINLQALNNDKKKWELKVVQRTLLRQKLEKQLVIKGLKYEEAKIELEVLKKQFSDNT